MFVVEDREIRIAMNMLIMELREKGNFEAATMAQKTFEDIMQSVVQVQEKRSTFGQASERIQYIKAQREKEYVLS